MASRATQFRKVQPALVEYRTVPRHSVVITTATVRRHGSLPDDAVLCDISAYGCRLESPNDYSAQERLWVRFPGSNPISATVVWARDGFTACRFDAPIERSLLRSMTLTSL
ncbi:PilZ domain-containing protein [Sphingomonas qilianensis]|uniref:PilZ domain-containing protein n=1 Tax=Sphingomonas qilianensis TaxID=1736690 RepID=A0ABU9XNS2_9SPHN